MRAKEIFENKKLKSDEFKSLLTPAVKQLNKVFTSNGFDIRIVGGAVRDLLLGKRPKDIDMATTARPEETLKLLRSIGIRVEETGLSHGTVTAIIDNEPIEITTLRIDTNQDGRHADVEFTTDWEKDAERRDLTFNAMSLSLDGTLYDYFGGAEDLKNHQAVFVGNAQERIREDFLRILRYFRFVGRQPTVKWDDETLNAIQKESVNLKHISGERIWSEMSKILGGNHVVELLKVMYITGVLKGCGFEMDKNLGKVSNLKAKNINDPRIILAALIPSIEALTNLRARWKFDTESFNLMAFIIKNRKLQLSFKTGMKMIILDKVDPKFVSGLFQYRGLLDLAKKIENWSPPEFPINGNDLIKLGMKPGKEMGELILALKKEWVDSNFTLTKDELLRKI